MQNTEKYVNGPAIFLLSITFNLCLLKVCIVNLHLVSIVDLVNPVTIVDLVNPVNIVDLVKIL